MFGLLRNLVKFCKSKQGRKLTIIIIGLNNAGKTSLLSAIRGKVDQFVSPTWGFDSETIKRGKTEITFYDMGGGESIRGIWTHYFAEVHGVIFVVDSADVDRIAEAKKVLNDSIHNSNLMGKSLLVMSNKKDLPHALSPIDMAEKLGLDEITKNYNILPCSAKTPEDQPIDPNIQKGVNWLVDSIKRNFSELSKRVESDMKEAKRKHEEEMAAKRRRIAARKEEDRLLQLQMEEEAKKKKKSKEEQEFTSIEMREQRSAGKGSDNNNNNNEKTNNSNNNSVNNNSNGRIEAQRSPSATRYTSRSASSEHAGQSRSADDSESLTKKLANVMFSADDNGDSPHVGSDNGGFVGIGSIPDPSEESPSMLPNAMSPASGDGTEEPQ